MSVESDRADRPSSDDGAADGTEGGPAAHLPFGVDAVTDATGRGASALRVAVERAVAGVRGALSRPAASDVAAAVVALAVVLASGSTLVGSRLSVLGVVAGLSAALATVLLASSRPVVRAVGGIVAVPVAVLVATPSTLAWAFALGIGGFGPVAGATLWALVIAGLAAGLVSWERMGAGGVRRAATGTLLVAVGVAAVVALRILPEAGIREQAATAAGDVGTIVADLLLRPTGDLALVTFFGIALVVAVLVRRTLSTLPMERLVPPDRRDALAAGLGRVRRGCTHAIRLALAGGVATLVVPILTDLEARPATVRDELPAPLGDALATAVTAPGVRAFVLAVGAVALAIGLAEWGRRALRRGLAGVLAGAFAPVLGGAVVALLVARALVDPALDATLEAALARSAPASVVDLIGSFPAFAVAAVVLVLALSSLSSTLFTVSWLRTIRLLPPRAIGAALAAFAAFLLAIVLAVAGRPEPAIWTAAGAFVVWDVGAYGHAIRAELGRDAPTLRAELVHVGGSVLTGLLVGAATVALSRWLAAGVGVVDRQLAAAAVAAGVVTLVLVSWTVRG